MFQGQIVFYKSMLQRTLENNYCKTIAFNMASAKPFEFTGEVAIVTGAGSRMPGKFTSISYSGMQENTDKT
jgi:hypothetical protein